MFRPTTPGQARRARRRFRPQLEMLEDRSVPAAIDLPAGAVSWWSGDGVTLDPVGANHGELAFRATYAPGLVGEAFSFDGMDEWTGEVDQVNVADSPSLTLGATFTIELWVNFDVIHDRNPFIGHDDGGGNFNKWIFWYDQQGHDVEAGVPALRFHVNPTEGLYDPIVAPWTPQTGRWYHVAVTRDASNYALYIDGAQVATSVDSEPIPDPSSPLTIGRAEDFFHDGLIDEPTIYNRALSAAEIQAIFNAGSDGKIKPSFIGAEPVTVLEGSAGTTSVGTFTIHRMGPLSAPLTVDWATADETATAGSDYVAASGQVTFLAGESQKTIQVTVIGDNVYEPSETFRVMLSTATPGYVFSEPAGTIANDEPTPGISLWGPTVTEGNAGSVSAMFTFQLGFAFTETVTVDYATVDGSAVAGADYLSSTGTVTFAPGQTSVSVAVSVLGDLIPEPNEWFRIVASNPVNSFLHWSDVSANIVDDEPRVSISIADATMTEGNVGNRVAVFTVTLSAPHTVPVSVDYSTPTWWGSYPGWERANPCFDYAGLTTSGTLTFTPGVTSRTISVEVYGDREPELTEFFYVELTNPTPTNNIITRGVALGLILDDEPRISISDVTKAEGKKGANTTFTFTVTLSVAYDQAVTVSYATVNGTATTANNDYVAKTGTITFSAGQTSKTITITVKGDSNREADETFFLDLFNNSSNSLLTKNRGVGTILNDD